MGHEIAHAVAKHSVERASRGVMVNVRTNVIDILSGGKLSQVNRTTGMNTVGMISQLGIMNPFNRKQESEADYLGMIFASLSGYNINEAVRVWKRMNKKFGKKEIPEFLSTHPSTKKRILDRWVWLIVSISVILTLIIGNLNSYYLGGYKVGYELLPINGIITYIGLILISRKQN